MRFSCLRSRRSRNRAPGVGSPMTINTVILLVVPMVILDSALSGLIIGILGFQDRQEIVGSTNEMNGPRSFGNLFFSFVTFFLFIDAMLFQEKLLFEAEIHIISDL